MKLPYMTTEPTEEVQTVAEDIVALLVDSGLTYQMADVALTTAQILLQERTKPVNA